MNQQSTPSAAASATAAIPLATPIPLAPPATDPQRRYLCRHIHTLGHRCHSPALRATELCYYHTRARVQAPLAGRSGTYPMPRVDDRAAVQLALYDLLSRIAGGDIDLKRAALLLRGLQTASLNLSRPHPVEPTAPPQVEHLIHHHHLGDLAPITEIPTSAEADTNTADILSETKDPDAASTTTTPRTFLPPKPGQPAVPLFSGNFFIKKQLSSQSIHSEREAIHFHARSTSDKPETTASKLPHASALRLAPLPEEQEASASGGCPPAPVRKCILPSIQATESQNPGLAADAVSNQQLPPAAYSQSSPRTRPSTGYFRFQKSCVLYRTDIQTTNPVRWS